MIKVFQRLAAAAAMISLGSVANAQSNALTSPQAGPPAARTDLSAVIGNGYAPISIGAFEAFLQAGGFTVTGREAPADGKSLGLIARAPNGMPFVFLFTECGLQGCLFVEAIQVFAPSRIGVDFDAAALNDFNRTSPLQVFMTTEANGQIGIRWVMPALIDCGDRCLQSAATLYFAAVIDIYQATAKAAKQVVVEAPFDDPRPVLDMAKLMSGGAAPLPAERWGTASLAFGEGALEQSEALLERFVSSRAPVMPKPGPTDFPALLPR